MEYSPFEFNDHTPQKFNTYCPTKDGFYLVGDPNYKYILDENQGQEYCIFRWADSNGCYYDANSKPAGWISISICGKQYKHYDLDQQIVKEGENKYYSNHVRKSNTNGSDQMKKKDSQQETFHDQKVLVKKQSNGSQKNGSQKQNNNQKEQQKDKQYIEKEQQPQKAQHRFKQEQSARENNEPVIEKDAQDSQVTAEIPQQINTKKKWDNSERNGKRKREREAKQNTQSDKLPEAVQYVEKQQSLEGKDETQQVVAEKTTQPNNYNKKEKRQNTKQQNEKKEQKEILYQLQVIKKDESIIKIEEYLENSYKLNPKFIKEIIDNKILLTDEYEAVKLFIQWQERKDDKIELLL